jgi:hypothetical protein
MRMPVFRYFVVMGAALALGLLAVSSYLEPSGSPIPASPAFGHRKTFTPEPERSPYAITATNFAAEHQPTPEKEAQAMDSPRSARAEALRDNEKSDPATDGRESSFWNRVAENPYNALLSIH